MKYKDFIIEASEHEPGKWKASISRVDGQPTTCEGVKLDRYTTASDAPAAAAAIRLACWALDDGYVT